MFIPHTFNARLVLREELGTRTPGVEGCSKGSTSRDRSHRKRVAPS